MKSICTQGIAIMLLSFWLQGAAAHSDIDIQLASVTLELEERPHDHTLYLRRAELRRHEQDWLGAEADLARAYELGTGEVHDQLHLYRGHLYQEAGQAKRAIAELDTYMTRHPEHLDALRIRALAHAQLNAFDAAAADYSLLIALDTSRSPELWLERARLWVRMGAVDTALQSIDDSIEEFGPLITLIEFGVDTEIDRQNYSAAIIRMDRLPRALAESPVWLWRRGTLFEKLDRSDEAALSYARARNVILDMPVRRRQMPAIQNLLAKLTVE